ncbi:AAA family ATPase [Coraliomargarita parva]|uniref:AAA family ATPase n=1 Tax=Coraliomargarita parva TaxID=3014050 RepID=UPI0022B4F87F|nr:AAA family ATPase [Coraliomargarita parva]
MSNAYGIAGQALKDYEPLKNKAVSCGGYSSFQIDFELRFALFLTALIDGDTNSSERAFVRAVKDCLNWSDLHEQLLKDRITSLPSYDFEHFVAARHNPDLGLLIFKVAGVLAAYDCDLSQDERLFFKNLEGILAPGQGEALLNEALGLCKRQPAFTDASLLGNAPIPVQNFTTVHESVEVCLAELNELIGLDDVKHEVERLTRYLEIQAQRRQHQLKQPPLTLHMVFTGNPGTGKTTVARVIAKVFRSLNILKKGHLVETDRMGLVGQYVGHTAKKTDEVVRQALDGILFIDEAYSLVSKSGENDFGAEAIDTLVKRIEDYRDRLVVIVAGYPREMEEFIETNPGLRSRFSTSVYFPNYAVSELLDILKSFCNKNEYHLSEEAEQKACELFDDVLGSDEQHFGNGRYVRNLFEQAIRNQALRLSLRKDELLRKELMLLKAEDFASCSSKRSSLEAE